MNTWIRNRSVSLRMLVSLSVTLLVLAVLLFDLAHSDSPRVKAAGPATLEAAAVNNPVLTIGMAAALTSPLGNVPWQQVNGAQLAVDQINAAGGVNIGGAMFRVNLVVEDSPCDGSRAVTAAQNLVNAGAIAVVGHTCITDAMLAQTVYNNYGIVFVNTTSSDPALTDQGYHMTFRTISRFERMPNTLLSYFREWRGYSRMAMVEIDGFSGAWVNDVVADRFTAMGGVITSRHHVDSPNDFMATLEEIQLENPEIIFIADDIGTRAGFFSAVAHRMGMGNVVIAWASMSEDKALLETYRTLADVGINDDYALMFFESPEDMPGYPAFNAAYQAANFAHHGQAAEMAAAYSYDALNIIFRAFGDMGTPLPSMLRDQIAWMPPYRGVVGTYLGFDEQGDTLTQWSYLEHYQEGDWVRLSPVRAYLPITMRAALLESGQETP